MTFNAAAPTDRIAIPALTLPLTIAATFLSAALLFSVQPMFTKLVLPILGGSPSVWSIAMVFFQGLLLCGYAYAHVLARWLPPRWALPVHLALMSVALVTLPIAIPAGWVRAPAGYEAPWLLGLFAMVVGLPFFALSANGPLLQAWFARTGHRDAKDPYFLYAASNIGSFAALLAYPVLIEPALKLKDQTALWMGGFVALVVLIGFAGWQMMRSAGSAAVALAPAEAVTGRQRLSWIALAFVPSGLLVAVTAHISTDVAAVPLLWVLPLALFLLTFVLVFSSKPAVGGPLPFLQVAGTALTLGSMVFDFDLAITIPLNLATFFVSAMVCHGALYARRPSAARLTEFYLFMSLGGCLGGLFAGLVAPQVFNTVLEYPILLVAALFCRPGFLAVRGWPRAAAMCLALIVLGWVGAMVVPPVVARAGVVVVLGLVLIAAWRLPAQAGMAAVALALSTTLITFSIAPSESFRSFFAVHRVIESADGNFRLLMSGTTVHGAERIGETGRPEPTSYYTEEGALGSAVSAIREAQGGTLRSVSVIGLGAGTLACNGWGAEQWRFFEIDPDVVDLATHRFRFLSSCAPDADIILGDARLTFADTTETSNLIVLDAFSSDSIPAHLITVEALTIYRDRLADNGAIIVHISNRNLDLTQILARTAADAGLVAYVYFDNTEEPRERRFRVRSLAMVLARAPEDIGTLASRWTRVEPNMARRPWTDDFSNILEAILDKARSPTP